MTQSPAPAIVWFRQDLRLADQEALHGAVASGRPVVAVYVLDEAGPGSSAQERWALGKWALGGAARWWLHHSLAALAAGLRERGGRLVLRRGPAAATLLGLMTETGAAELHAGRMHEPWGRAAEAELGAALGGRLRLHRTSTLFDLDAIRTGTGGVYGVYTPFARACRARGEVGAPLEAPGVMPPAPDVASERLEDWELLPRRPDWAAGLRATWVAGEAAGQARLRAFLGDAVGGYASGRNLPGEPGTSMISAHLHWGELSARQVWSAAMEAGPGEGRERFLGEILWREFAAYLLWHHPTMPEAPLRAAFGRLPFRDAPGELRAWQRGRTGFPIVDAGMRQLWQLGWMHNRVRMIAASFLVKQLLIDWREGERWFWDTLVDADLASNAASWQWVAGSGIDSQPFFRVFNPVSQGGTWDAAGSYVRRWVPELAGVPDRFLHAPWTAPEAVLAAAGVVLGRDYPRPMVDLAAARQRALETYRATVRDAA